MSIVKKPGIPSVTYLSPDIATVLGPIKETLEIMTGVRGKPLAQLATSAATTDIISKVNEIIARLNATGT